MKLKRSVWVALVLLMVVAATLVYSSAYVVKEWDQVVVTEFGKPVGDPVTEPGLKFKKPFIQTATYFPKRILEWDGEKRDILTSDKETITVNTCARWKIVDPLLFYRSLRSISRGQGVLDEQIGSAAQKVIKAHPLMEVLRNEQRTLEYTTSELEEIEKQKKISIELGRTAVVEKIKEMAAQGLDTQYGIELIDVRIKQINYVSGVIEKIYLRMRSERKRIKDRYESEGKRRKEEIEGEIEREKAKLESEGYRLSKEITGKADADALKIYADAFQRDVEFYSFLKTLEAYEKTFGAQTHLVLSTDSEFYRYLKDYMKVQNDPQDAESR